MLKYFSIIILGAAAFWIKLCPIFIIKSHRKFFTYIMFLYCLNIHYLPLGTGLDGPFRALSLSLLCKIFAACGQVLVNFSTGGSILWAYLACVFLNPFWDHLYIRVLRSYNVTTYCMDEVIPLVDFGPATS